MENDPNSALLLTEQELCDSEYRIRQLAAEHRLLRHKKFREENILILHKDSTERTPTQQSRIDHLLAASQQRSAILGNSLMSAMPRDLRAAAFTNPVENNNNTSKNNTNINESSSNKKQNENENTTTTKTKTTKRPIKSSLSRVLDIGPREKIPRDHSQNKGIKKIAGIYEDASDDAFFLHYDTTAQYARPFELQRRQQCLSDNLNEKKKLKSTTAKKQEGDKLLTENKNENESSTSIISANNPTTAKTRLLIPTLHRTIPTATGASIEFHKQMLNNCVDNKQRSVLPPVSTTMTPSFPSDHKVPRNLNPQTRSAAYNWGPKQYDAIKKQLVDEEKSKEMKQRRKFLLEAYSPASKSPKGPAFLLTSSSDDDRKSKKKTTTKVQFDKNGEPEEDYDEDDEDEENLPSVAPPETQTYIDASREGPPRKYIRAGAYLIADRRRGGWNECDKYFIETCPPRKIPQTKNLEEKGFGLLMKKPMSNVVGGKNGTIIDDDVSELTA